MLEILKFVFSSPWIFAGSILILAMILVAVPANIIKIEIHHRDPD